MKVQIDLVGTKERHRGEPESPKVLKMRDRLEEIFTAYEPKRVSEEFLGLAIIHSVLQVAPGEAKFEQLLESFGRELEKVKVGAVVRGELAGAELKRARYLDIAIAGDSIADVDEQWSNRSKWPTLCSACGFPDITKVPTPLLVDPRRVKKPQQEVFGTFAGLLIVRPRALALLKEAIGNQIEIGEARIDGDQRKNVPAEEQLWWVRPRMSIGSMVRLEVADTCKTCGRVTHAVNDLSKADKQRAIDDRRPWVEHFGKQPADLAVAGNAWFHVGTGRTGSWELFMSGALWTYLKENKVSGLQLSEKCCLLSKKGEEALEKTARAFKSTADAKSDAAAIKKRTEEAKKIVAKLKKVPWGHEKDGHIYLYLTTPQVMLVDPMTLAEGGPFEMKKFKPGLHRVPVAAIRNGIGKEAAVPVDSGSMVLIDAAFLPAFSEAVDDDTSWEDPADYQKLAERIGNRFGFCIAPGIDSGCEFEGDGAYVLDLKKIERVER